MAWSPVPSLHPGRGPALPTHGREAIGLAAAPLRWTVGAQWAWPEGVARWEAEPRALSQ